MNTSHYPSLELCKKLTEIGFPNTTLLSFCDFSNYSSKEDIRITDVGISTPRRKDCMIAVCPSIMEMLDEIPHSIYGKNNLGVEICWHPRVRKNGICYDVGMYNREEGVCIGGLFQSKELPNALAEMILWLHENNYISFS